MWALLEYENKSSSRPNQDQPSLAEDKESETQVEFNTGKQTFQHPFFVLH